MVRVLKRPEAATDLENIWSHIAQDKPAEADRLLNNLQAKMVLLAEFPQMGACQDTLMPALRSFSMGNYLIFYFPLQDGIDVVRVLHGARDLATIFEADD
jgi:toxin ParE1/3/4